ncbi:branched-chain amino acid ABC transporter substrate-binding protein [Methylobacterium sp. Leaf108]|uniref:branched-chain amino acid ABC transporter substrate-binding protein n=1 Tax=Methylobacterium sp. Leaf108 TaxID=1736256 RepID=UPI0006F84A31|nr:branched-chain amino acid ABC transporter substrate-binding protein [Methylobacterium sp. Leaf108]KQP61339.1 amino acid ABC transporter substrate-binding protein [Methylobacterium sp. Leaf108]
MGGVLWAALAFAVLTMSGWGLAAEAQTVVRIGLSAPLTGPDAAFGQGMRLAAEQAVADLNRTGGQTFALVVADDGGDPRQGLAAAKRLAADKVGFVVGPLTPSVAALVAPAYEAAGIVLVTPGVSWAPLTARGAWNVFRTGGSDAEQGRIAGTHLTQAYGGRRIGIVHDKSAFGRGLADEVSRVLKASGRTDAAFEGFDRGERDLSRLVARLARAQVEVVYLGGLAADAAVLVKALRNAGLTVPLVGSDGLIDRDFAPDAEGTLMTALPEPRKLPDPKLPDPKQADLKQADLKGATARSPRSPEAEAIAGRTYAAVEVLARAMAQAKSTDGRRVAAWLHAGRPVKTLIGDVSYDARGDLTASGYALHAWRRTGDGRVDYVGNQITP